MYKYFISVLMILSQGLISVHSTLPTGKTPAHSSSDLNTPGTPVLCCSKNPTETFALFASDLAFVRAHKNPPVFHYHSFEGKDIHYKTSDGKDAHAFAFIPTVPSKKYLFVIHDFFGLGDFAKSESMKLFHDLKDVNVIALDLYDNKSSTSRDSAAKLMQAVKTDRAFAIIRGAIQYAGQDAKIATIGWCFGGGWSLQTALAAGDQTIGCVIYYGMPEKDIQKLKTLHSDVLGIYAKKDKWINPQVVSAFEADMKTAGKKIEVHSYDADHGFANPTTPGDNAAATQDAYSHTIGYLSARFK